MSAGSQGFRPYSARLHKDGTEASGGPAAGADAESPRGGATATHLSASMVGGGLQAPDVAAGAPHDRNRSVSSVPRAATPVQAMTLMQQQQQQQQQQNQHNQQNQQLPQQQPQSTGPLTGLSRFTAGFPPGPQHNFVSQLPWFTQLQNAQLQSAQLQGTALAGAAMPGGLMHGAAGNADDYAAVMAAAAAGAPRFRSSSFPNDVVNRLQSLSSQPSMGSARPKRKSMLSAAPGEGSMLYDDADMGGAGRFDSLGMAAEDGDLGEEEDEEEDAESRTRRRLAQNREAARKSRQRRKQYVGRLEAEVRQLRWQVQQQGGKPGGAGGGVPPSGGRAASAAGRLNSPAKSSRATPDGSNTDRSPSQPSGEGVPAPKAGLQHDAASLGDLGPSGSQVEILAAFARWRKEHTMTAHAVREALRGGPSREAQLRTLADEARSQLWGFFQMKRAVAYSEGVGLIAGLAHLPPVERPFAWLGSGPLRPSDAAGGLLDRLQRGGGGGDDDGRSAMQLQILKESLAQQEAMLSQGFERVAAELRRHAASVMPHPAEDAGASIWTSPEVLGRLDALRTLLLQADGLWQQFLEETQRSLPLGLASQAAIALADASAQLAALGGTWAPLPGAGRPTQGPSCQQLCGPKPEGGAGQ